MTPDLLNRVLTGRAPAYALLYRPETTGQELLEVLLGEVSSVETLAEIPVPQGPAAGPRHETLAIVPYRQITERGSPAPTTANR